MLQALLAILIVLWFFGIVTIPWLTIPHIVIFRLNGLPITLREVLLFVALMWAINVLPSPLRQIASVLFILWLLSLVGIVSIAGFSNIILLAVIIGVAIALFSKK